MAPYQASGLGSGLDTLAIIDQFVELQKQPITMLQKRQATVQTQISKIGEVTTKLNAFTTAAEALRTGGVRTNSVTSTNTNLAATISGTASAGTYNVEVTGLATNAKWRSGAYTSASDVVARSNLTFSVDGKNYSLAVATGTTLTQLATQINALGAPITASIFNAGAGTYLNIEATQTGFAPGSAPSSALSITEQNIGGAGAATRLNLASVQTATNATMLVDGFAVERRTNNFDDVIAGVTLTAKNVGAAERLTIATDAAASTKKLQTFVDAYKDVVNLLDVLTANTTVSKGVMATDSSLRDLRNQLNRLTTTTVPGLTGVSTLGDLGVGHDRYGTVTFDSSKLSKQLTTNPNSVDAFFQQATTGLSQVIKDLGTRATAASTGTLSIRSEGLRKVSTDYQKQVDNMNRSLEAYRKNLEAQFTAMETTVGALKKIGSYLTQQTAAQNRSNS